LSVPSIQACLERHRSCYRPIAGFIDQVIVFERLAARAVSLKQRVAEGEVEEEPPLDAASEALNRRRPSRFWPARRWSAIIGDEARPVPSLFEEA